MKPNLFPAHITDKLDQLTQAAEFLAEQTAKGKDAITAARRRLSGGFQSDQEFTDLRATLDQLVKDQPILERKLRDAQFVLADCKAWLDGLPSDAVLEPVTVAKHDDDLSLDDVRRRIADMQDEIARLRAVPTPSPDLETRIKGYVAGLARPRVSGVAAGQQLRVDWPTKDPIALLAFLLPEQMVGALTKEIVRSTNTPSPDERKRRIAELEGDVEGLQRRALALGADLCVMPAPVVLGVRATRQTKRAA